MHSELKALLFSPSHWLFLTFSTQCALQATLFTQKALRRKNNGSLQDLEIREFSKKKKKHFESI